MKITKREIRKIIKEAILKIKEGYTVIGDDDFVDEIDDQKSCELCNDKISEKEYDYNRGICDYCSRSPKLDNGRLDPSLQW